MSKLILASASPARKKLLFEAGINFEAITSDVDEEALVAKTRPASVAELVQILAKAKAESVATRLENQIVLGCDSALEFESEALGKPLYPDVAIERWKRMSGKSGILYTGHYLIDQTTGKTVQAVTGTKVNFAKLSESEIEGYVATGEPLQVAGAFTIDSLGGGYIKSIEGDYHTVVGLSLAKLRVMLLELGYKYEAFWR